MSIQSGDLVKLRDSRWQVELMLFNPSLDLVQLVYDYMIVTEQEGAPEHKIFEVEITTPPMLYLGQEEITIQRETVEMLNLPINLGSKYWISKFLHEGKIWFSVARYRNGYEQCFVQATSNL